MKIISASFACSAVRAGDEPPASGPEVLFVGRSNVGKSSLINRLLGVRGLARTSSRPGRTQTANFYRVNEAFWFVDLPGYGFAAVPAAVRRTWGPIVEGLVARRRDRIAGAVLVVDARHGPTELDSVMAQWLDDQAIPAVVAATKSDTMSGNGRAAAERALAAFAPGADALLVSAKTGAGIAPLWRWLDEAVAAQAGRVARP